VGVYIFQKATDLGLFPCSQCLVICGDSGEISEHEAMNLNFSNQGLLRIVAGELELLDC
jgi:hypothetical protein